MLARGLLPFWVEWGRWLVLGPLVFASIWWFGLLEIVLLRPKDAEPSNTHWTERARIRWSLRSAPMACGLAAGALILGLHRRPWSAFDLGRSWDTPLAVLLASGLGILCLRRRLVESRGPGQTFRQAARSRAVRFFGALGALPFLAPLLFLPPRPWELRWLGEVALLFSCALFFSYGGALFLAHRLGLVRAASERAQAIVTRACQAAGIRPPEVLQIDLARSLAFVYPLQRVLLLTPPLVAGLADAELEALLSQALPGLESAGYARLRPLLLPLTALAIYLGPITGWMSLVPLGLVFLVLRLSERTTTRPPAEPSESSSERARNHLRALEHVLESNRMPMVLTARPGPQNLYDRMAAAGVRPAYDRPAPPTGTRPGSLLIAFGLLGFLAGRGLTLLVESAPERASALLALALFGPSPHELGRLGRLESERDAPRGVELLRAAVALDPDSASAHGDLALALAAAGRCDDARAELSEAERLASDRREQGRDRAELLERARSAVERCRPH